MIPFNKPYLTGNEIVYMAQAVKSGHISGNGLFTRKCHSFFEEKYNFKKVLLTSSCTDALEMASILLNIQPGDEIIIPSFTFVSTANAFALRGARIVFADSEVETPNIDADSIEGLITEKTRAIVVVHYAGVACDMDKIMKIAFKHRLSVIEDAAHSIDSYYKSETPLGSIGTLAAFSFHETKNIISGEGGMLVINEDQLVRRAEIIWEKGTNRAAFFRGEINKYEWVDIGSSFLPSELTAAFLFAQIENLASIQNKRMDLWMHYYKGLIELEKRGYVNLPVIHDYSSNNAHMFYLVCRNTSDRDKLITYLKTNGIHAVFHYLPLHGSSYFCTQYQGKELPRCDRFSLSIVRLPFFYELSTDQVSFIIETIIKYFKH